MVRVEDRQKWDEDLLLPLPGDERVDTPVAAEAEGEDFMKFMGTMQ